jgi:plasmid stabilization system protein ParE
MNLKIIWSDFAIKQLDEIFIYYQKHIGTQRANKIIFNILHQTKTLETKPYIGQVEHLLGSRKHTYRYLIVAIYKIVYRVDETEKRIKIMDVFDTRQNPIKLTRVK